MNARAWVTNAAGILVAANDLYREEYPSHIGAHLGEMWAAEIAREFLDHDAHVLRAGPGVFPEIGRLFCKAPVTYRGERCVMGIEVSEQLGLDCVRRDLAAALGVLGRLA